MPEETNNLSLIKHILVCLDLTSVDEKIIEYTSFFARVVPVEKVIFYHAVQEYDLPDGVSRRLDKEHINLEMAVRENLEETIENHFPRKVPTELITDVESENASSSVIHYIAEKEIDLAILGQKTGEQREGVYGKSIAAESQCHILFVPEEADLGIKNILFASDFSPESEKAFEFALKVAEAEDAEISCQFIFDVTASYFPVSSMNITEKQEEQWKEKVENYFSKHGIEPDEISCAYIDEEKTYDNEAQRVYEQAIETEADFIILGMKGNTTNVTSLLGNIAENFRLMEKEIPVFIFKSFLYDKTIFQRLFGQ